MHTSDRIIRAAFLTLALVLSSLALILPIQAQECYPPADRWVWRGDCCSGLTYAKWYHQWCDHGVWKDDGATKCSGPCPV